MARLILTFGDKIIHNHLVAPDSEITIGRDLANDMVIEHPSVSGRHAKIRRANDGLHISDLGSTNGTFVNDDKVVNCQLAHQDWVHIGKHVLIVDLYETLSLESTVQMLLAGASGAAEADGTMMLDMDMNGGTRWSPPDYLNFVTDNQPDFELSGKQVTIGKNQDADIVVTGFWSFLAGQPSATITKRDEDYYIDHVAGILRPKVNDAPINQPTRLNHHDVIRVGPLCLQLYLIQ